jgi:hypothetical protein
MNFSSIVKMFGHQSLDPDPDSVNPDSKPLFFPPAFKFVFLYQDSDHQIFPQYRTAYDSPKVGAALAQEVDPVLEGEGLLQPQLPVESAPIRIEPVGRGDFRPSHMALLQACAGTATALGHIIRPSSNESRYQGNYRLLYGTVYRYRLKLSY